MENTKENENKLIYLKDKVVSTENKRKVIFNEKNDEIKKKLGKKYDKYGKI